MRKNDLRWRVMWRYGGLARNVLLDGICGENVTAVCGIATWAIAKIDWRFFLAKVLRANGRRGALYRNRRIKLQ